MNLGDLQTNFLNLLNRTDCTTDLATTFLVQSMQRIQREVRLPSMERMVLYNPTVAMEQVQVPPDFIELIDIFVQADPTNVDTTVALEHLPYRKLIRYPSQASPRFYSRLQAAFHFRGLVNAGATLQLVYYGEFSALNGTTDENEIMASSPDLVTYGALALAGDYFQHPQADAWEQRYQQFLGQVQQLAIDVEFGGGALAVEPSHTEF